MIPKAIQKKAERNLLHVAEIWSQSLPCACTVRGAGLTQGLDLSDIEEFICITLRYVPRNKVFAILFDLEVSVSVSYKMEKTSSSTNALSLENLDAIMKERVESLGIYRITEEGKEGARKIICYSMVGSSTWNLIPLVMHLITPSQEECLRYTELLRMLACER